MPFVYTNIVGTINLLDMVIKYKVSNFIQVSTDEVFGSIDTGYFNENSQNYKPYFKFSEKLKVPKTEENTFISEIMLFNRDYIKELFSINNLNRIEDILEFIYENVDETSQLSEYELYGNFIKKYHPNSYEDKHIKGWGSGMGSYDESFWDENRMTVIYEVYSKNFDVMSFHTYN
jgi:hypothetical protein